MPVSTLTHAMTSAHGLHDVAHAHAWLHTQAVAQGRAAHLIQARKALGTMLPPIHLEAANKPIQAALERSPPCLYDTLSIRSTIASSPITG